jgi:hypothetical protein
MKQPNKYLNKLIEYKILRPNLGDNEECICFTEYGLICIYCRRDMENCTEYNKCEKLKGVKLK